MRIAEVKMVPGAWGGLGEDSPLTKERVEEKARHLLAGMSLDEKVHQMSGDTPFLRGIIELAIAYNEYPIPAGENLRLSIPGIRFTDGPRGVVMYHSTCFPVAIARGASWDTDLEERVGDAIGVEARSQGANFFAGVCINALRHPAWGRAQETYGEDPHHLGEMGAALVRGVQRHVMACIKHFAANSIENSRFRVDVRMNERTLREVYLPHFKRCVDEGAASVMSAYNKVNGHYCGHNAHLLREILKGEWGFEGFVMSDFVFGIRSPQAASAGLDVEMPLPIHFGRRLKRLLRKGRISEDVIDEAVLRILRQKVRFSQVGEPARYGPQAVAGPEHRALAREVAQKSIVLLRNERVGDSDPVLPIDTARVKGISVIGRLAEAPNVGDKGSSMVRQPYAVTPLAGISAAAPADCRIDYCDGRNVARAANLAREADLAIVVAGYTHRDEGERIPYLRGGDRDSLRLKPRDESLISRIAAVNPRTVVVLVGGSAIITEAWREEVPAILMAWYPGMEGGNALADILFGRANPGAKLPCVFPASESYLPFFDKDARSIEYGYYHGYRLMDRDGHVPAFPFGFGLSYTSYAYRDLRLDRDEIDADRPLRVSVEVTNTGGVVGEETAQLYVGYDGSRVERPLRELKGFVKVRLAPGEVKRVEFELRAAQLGYYDVDSAGWVVEPITCTAFVGPSSREEDLLSAQFKVRS